MAGTLPSYSLFLPEDFIELPEGEVTEAKITNLASALAVRVGYGADAELDQELAAATSLVMTLGASAYTGGAHYVATALYKSARAKRPLMIIVSCFLIPSNHDSPEVALTGLRQHHEQQTDINVKRLAFPGGDAIVTRAASTTMLAGGDQEIPVTNHVITAWFPHPTSAAVLGVAISSNNTADWDDIVDLAHGIFTTVEWDPHEDEGRPCK